MDIPRSDHPPPYLAINLPHLLNKNKKHPLILVLHP